MVKELRRLINLFEDGKVSINAVEEKMETISPHAWDEWIRLDQSVYSFDKRICQYILIVDRLSPEQLESYSILRRITWKFVLDLDPKSQEGGLLSEFKKCEDRDAIIVPHTPNSIKQQKVNLEKTLDFKKMHWVFVNGQSDNEGNEPKGIVTAWKKTYASLITRFMAASITRFDTLKPVVCVILPLQSLGREIAPQVIARLQEELGSNEFNYRFVSINENSIGLEEEEEHECYTIPPSYLESGVRSILGAPKSRYQLPCRIEGTYKSLELRAYLYLKEN